MTVIGPDALQNATVVPGYPAIPPRRQLGPEVAALCAHCWQLLRRTRQGIIYNEYELGVYYKQGLLHTINIGFTEAGCLVVRGYWDKGLIRQDVNYRWLEYADPEFLDQLEEIIGDVPRAGWWWRLLAPHDILIWLLSPPWRYALSQLFASIKSIIRANELQH